MQYIPLCQVHNQNIIFCDDDAEKSQEFLCKLCMVQKFKISTIEDYDQIQRKNLQDCEARGLSFLVALKKLNKNMKKYKQKMSAHIEKIVQTIKQQTQVLKENQIALKGRSKQAQALTKHEVKQEENQIENIFKEVRSQINEQLVNLIEAARTESLFEVMNSLGGQKIKRENSEIEESKQNESSQIPETTQDIGKKFEYIPLNTNVLMGQGCYDMRFNDDNSLFFAVSSNLVKVFEFKEEKLEEVQVLKAHTNHVYCLHYLNKSKTLLTAGNDGIIFVWEKKDKKWEHSQILKGHQLYILCLTSNIHEDLMISGSQDKTIKFWTKNNSNVWNCLQTLECSNHIYSLSLSEQSNKLIATSNDKQILIIEEKHNSWFIVQRIDVESKGYRVKFVGQHEFVFQPYSSQKLQIYNFNQTDNAFSKAYEMNCQRGKQDGFCLFPIQFQKQLNLLMIKNGEYVNFFKKGEDGKFKEVYSIHMDTYTVFGCMSDDGMYVATWSNKSNELEIRKYKEIV